MVRLGYFDEVARAKCDIGNAGKKQAELPLGRTDEGVCPYASRLDIQVLYVQGVFFDELATRFYVFAHQRGEDGFGFGDVLEFDGEQRAALRVHGRLP